VYGFIRGHETREKAGVRRRADVVEPISKARGSDHAFFWASFVSPVSQLGPGNIVDWILRSCNYLIGAEERR
jgi:hypothetical protein